MEDKVLDSCRFKCWQGQQFFFFFFPKLTRLALGPVKWVLWFFLESKVAIV
jgi:hypothetical protein